MAQLRFGSIVFICLVTTLVEAQNLSDRAIRGVLQRADPTVASVRTLSRVQVTPEHDVVITVATAKDWPFGAPQEWEWWNTSRKMGIFVQERRRPEQIYTLAIETGPSMDCAARIIRVAVSDAVVECRGEKSERNPHRKFVYDVRAKSLVKAFEYEPVSMSRVLAAGDGAAVIVGVSVRSDNEEGRRIAIEYVPDRVPEFRVLSGAAEGRWVRSMTPKIEVTRFGRGNAFRVDPLDPQVPLEFQILETRSGKTVTHTLPQSTDKMLAAERTEFVRHNRGVDFAINEYVGPFQVEGEQLWFGKTFYDGEGSTGVGGFGYFDGNDRRFQLFTSPEIADWSVSAIRVTSEAVWLALAHRGEYGDSNGGVLRFDRRTGTYQRFAIGDVGREFANIGVRIVLATDNGVSIIVGNESASYFVDQTTDGRRRVVPLMR